jgi:hypothetical protein
MAFWQVQAMLKYVFSVNIKFNNLTNHFWAPFGDFAALCGLPAFSKII